MNDIDRDCLDWMLSQKSVLTPLTEQERQLVDRRRVSIIVAEAGRQYSNWKRGLSLLHREQHRPEPRPRRLGEVWSGQHRQPGRPLGGSAPPQLLTEGDGGYD
jgi:hypothetical protein